MLEERERDRRCRRRSRRRDRLRLLRRRLGDRDDDEERDTDREDDEERERLLERVRDRCLRRRLSFLCLRLDFGSVDATEFEVDAVGAGVDDEEDGTVGGSLLADDDDDETFVVDEFDFVLGDVDVRVAVTSCAAAMEASRSISAFRTAVVHSGSGP